MTAEIIKEITIINDTIKITGEQVLLQLKDHMNDQVKRYPLGWGNGRYVAVLVVF